MSLRLFYEALLHKKLEYTCLLASQMFGKHSQAVLHRHKDTYVRFTKSSGYLDIKIVAFTAETMTHNNSQL